jgi:hypothetical protein
MLFRRRKSFALNPVEVSRRKFKFWKRPNILFRLKYFSPTFVFEHF